VLEPSGPNTDDPNTDDPNTDDPNTDDPNTITQRAIARWEGEGGEILGAPST
jgi:hypothetical protein